MAEFKSYALNPEFRPRATVDTAGKLRKKLDRDLQYLQEWQARNQELDRQQIEDTKFVGQDIKALASLTKSGQEYFNALAIRTKEDIETGEFVDSIFTDPDDIYGSPQEEEIIRQGLFEQGLAGEAISRLQANGDDHVAGLVEKSFKIGGGLARENALLQDAKGALPGRVQALLNDSSIQINVDGTKIPITELSQDPAYANYAVRYAVKLALKERGLNYATKKQLKQVLGGTISQVMQNTTTSLVSNAIKLEQTDNRQLMTTGAANMGADYANGTLQLDPQVAFDGLVATNRARNTGLSKGQINSNIAQALYAGAGSNKQAILELSNLKSGSGTLGGAYPIVLRDALAAADRLGKAERASQADAMALQASEQIRQMLANGTPLEEVNRFKNQQRDQIAAIDPGRATSFSSQVDNTYIDSQADQLEQTLRDQIMGGREMSPQELIDTGLDPTRISRLQSYQDVSKTTRELKPELDSDMKALTASVMNGAGIKFDSVTNKYQLSQGWVDGAVVQQALDRYRYDKSQHMERWLRTNKNILGPDELNKQYLLESRRFDEQELAINGSYGALGQLRDMKTEADQETKNSIAAALKQYTSPNSVNSIVPTRQQPQNDYSKYVSNGNVPLAVRDEWDRYGGVNSNLGILNAKETQTENDYYTQNGTFSEEFKSIADQLGTSPGLLINNQNRRYGLPQLKQAKPQTYSTSFTHKPGPDLTPKQQREIQPTIAQTLMGPEYNFAPAAAKVLSYPFATFPESDWKTLISSFSVSPKMMEALTNPDLSEKQFVVIFNQFLRLNQQ